MKTVKDFEEAVRGALMECDRYTSGLEPQIYTLASALRALALANSDIDGLEGCTVDTPQGVKAHPVFRIRKEAEDSVTRQLKALGLTAAALASETEDDELVELTRAVAEAGQRKK